MANYIDGDAVIRRLTELKYEDDTVLGRRRYDSIIGFLRIQPVIDATEVVRCPECIYCENMKCTELKDNTGQPLDVAIFDYCSQGVSKWLKI